MKSWRVVPVLMVAAMAQAQGDLQATLAKLDASSAKFTSAQAKVHRDAYTKFMDEHEPSDGSMYLIREKGKAQFGLKTTGKQARTIEYKDGTIRVYNPAKAACYDTVTKPGIDTYVTLGFGGSGKDLAAAWTITDLGPETMNGTKVEKLDLAPKDASVKTNLTHVMLWIDPNRDVSLQQVFYSPNGDTNTATYSEIKTAGSIDMKAFAIKGKPCG